MTLSVVDDRVLLFGGLEYDPQSEEPFRFPLEVLEASTEGELAFASTGVALPQERRAFASAVHGGRIYLVGGMGPDFSEVGESYVLDPSDLSFSEIASPPRGVRISAHLVPVGDRLALLAGSYLGQGGRARVIELYDPATDTWSECAAELDFEAGHVHAVAFGDRLLLASAQEEPGRVHLRLIDPRPRPNGVEDAADWPSPAF